MSSSDQITFAVIISTLLFLLIVGLVVILMIINSNRRKKHAVQVAEMRLQRDREVMQAEREATEQTLTEVGRELHDNIGQLLTVAQMGLRNNLEDEVQDEEGVAKSMETLNQGIDEVRRLGRSLNTDMWRDRTLCDAIFIESERLNRMRVSEVSFEHSEIVGDPDSDSKTILYRCFQEVLSNAIRHGQARSIAITLHGGGLPTLTIKDDGKGFELESMKGGAGLNNIRRRSELIGYEAILESSKGAGCKWIFIPMADEVE